MTRRITWPQGGSTGAAVSDVDDAQPLPPDQTVKSGQAAIPSVAVAPLVTLADVIASATATRATLNTLLAELRASGVIAP